MKKLLAFLLAVALMACLLCACGKGEDQKDDTKTTNTTAPVGDSDTDSVRTQVIYGTDASGNVVTQVVTLPNSEPTTIVTTAASSTKKYYRTDAAGSTITTVIVLPGEGETFPIETAAPTTTSPTFEQDDDDPFNDADLSWD